MEYAIFDIESDGLLDKATKIHCFSYSVFKGKELLEKKSLTTYTDIKAFLARNITLVGHNITTFDVPLIKKILNVEVENKLIDTLGISYYHYPVPKFKHGLGPWGERLGFGKPVVEDWENQPLEVYVNRCEADVEINTRLFHFQIDYLMDIYDQDFNAVERILGYLGFKLDCLLEQQEERIKLDVRLAEKSFLDLEFHIDEKISILSKHMPRIVEKEQPKVMYKKDGSLSVHGERWLALLKTKGLSLGSTVITTQGSPTSPKQLKDWLFQLGWKPKTFKLNKAGEKIPQVSLPRGAGLCHSVEAMFEQHTYLEELGGLYRARHRLGLFKSFLDNKTDDDFIYSRAHGFTNTLRLQHSKPIANLPKVGTYYGKEVRGCLIVPDDSYIMIGSDVSGLEDNTKQHYIYFYDPDYVTEMRVPGFDPHNDIAVLSGLMTKEDSDFYSWADRQHNLSTEDTLRFAGLKKIRDMAKTINFSATYGAGPAKIADTLKCSIEEATLLHKTYWDRNAAVKRTAKACRVKTVRGQKWLYNPISGFWMFLKAEKDRFSTLNQSSGVYVFDTWLRHVRRQLKPLGIRVCMQYHDELLITCKKPYKDVVERILKSSMEEVNETLGLNVSIGIDTQTGNSYADCH